MAEVKGKFITLVGSLMTTYKEQLNNFNQHCYSKTGKHWDELDRVCDMFGDALT